MCQLRVTFLYGTTRNPKQKNTHTFRHGRTNGKSIRVMMMMPACSMQTLGKFFVSMRCATTLILYFNFFFRCFHASSFTTLPCLILILLFIHKTFFALSLPFFCALSLGPYFPCICCCCCCCCRCRYCWLISLQSVRNNS